MDINLRGTFITDKDDPAVLKQRPPKFDADLIAELVIRIITTTNSKRNRNSITNSSGSSAESSANNVTVLSNASNGNVPQLSQHNNNNVKSATSTKIGGNNRLANLQRTAAKIRNEATSTPTSTSTTTINATSVTPNTAVSLHTNSKDKANSTSTTAASATSTASEESGDAILVFLSGIQSIEKVSKALRQRGILQSLKAQVHSSGIVWCFCSAELLVVS